MNAQQIFELALQYGAEQPGITFDSEALLRYTRKVQEIEREACAQIADEKEREMQARVDTLHAMYEQACQHRDQLMDERRATIAAMRGKTQ